MLIIKIIAEENGGHANQKYNESIQTIPEGWALVSDTIIIPETFPFVNIEVDGQVVTSMTEGVVPPIPPQPDPPDPPQPTEDVWDELADAIKQGVNQA